MTGKSTFCKRRGHFILSNPCYEVTVVKMAKSPKKTGINCLIYPRHPKRDAEETEYGIDHSVIRGLVTNRSMVRRQHCQSNVMDHIERCADIGVTQIAETFFVHCAPFRMPWIRCLLNVVGHQPPHITGQFSSDSRFGDGAG